MTEKTKTKPSTPFELALAAKQGKIKPDELHGAAKLLFKQQDEASLRNYVQPSSEPREKIFNKKPGKIRARSF